MSTRRKSGPPMATVNPLLYMAAKQTLPEKEVDEVAMHVLTAFDACKRGQATTSLVNKVTEHLAVAQALWARTGNKPLYDQACKAWQTWCIACNREPEKPFGLTTKEYAAARVTLGYYLRALPKVELGRLVQARNVADDFLRTVSGKEAA